MTKIDKRLLDLATPKIIIKYEGPATRAQLFVEVESCDRGLCQHDATNMVSWMIDASKSKKATNATSSLVETQSEKTLHCWGCGEFSHTKNDPNCPKNLKKKDQFTKKPKHKIDRIKARHKSKKKQLKCSHCGRLNHDLDHCFVLHSEKRSVLEKEKALESKIAEFEKTFNNVASLGQVTKSKWTSRVGATESTINPYMFGAFREMVAAVAACGQ